jgi:hypothetical protein
MVAIVANGITNSCFLLGATCSSPEIRTDFRRSARSLVWLPEIVARSSEVSTRNVTTRRVDDSNVEFAIVNCRLEERKSDGRIDDEIGLLHSCDRGRGRSDDVSFKRDTVDASASSSDDFGAEPDCCFSRGHERMLLLLSLFRRKHHAQRRAERTK